MPAGGSRWILGSAGQPNKLGESSKFLASRSATWRKSSSLPSSMRDTSSHRSGLVSRSSSAVLLTLRHWAGVNSRKVIGRSPVALAQSRSGQAAVELSCGNSVSDNGEIPGRYWYLKISAPVPLTGSCYNRPSMGPGDVTTMLRAWGAGDQSVTDGSNSSTRSSGTLPNTISAANPAVRSAPPSSSTKHSCNSPSTPGATGATASSFMPLPQP